MARLFIYRGLPGSGKTTRAREMQRLTHGRLVGRDHIRPLLGFFNGVGTPDQEAAVTKFQERLIRYGLRAGQMVIVDDMNLRAKYVRRLMEIGASEGAEVDIADLTHVPVSTCINRDLDRGLNGGRSVGADVIYGLHERFIRGKGWPLPVPNVEPKPELNAVPYVPAEAAPAAVIVDIDGTVAHNDWHRDWHDYAKVGGDKPKPDVIRMVRAAYDSGALLLFVSGRKDSCYTETRQWLNRHVTTSGKLFMRRSDDNRDDSIVKLEIFNEHIRDNYRVVGVFDDRQRVVDMWRSLGLTVFQVAPGDF